MAKQFQKSQQGVALDWTSGWGPCPRRSGGPHHSIGNNSLAYNTIDKGFRDTYVTQYTRSFRHVPGPGAHRAPREFPMLDGGDASKGSMHSGRLADSFSCAVGQTAQAHVLSRTRHGRHHLKDGEDVDARRTMFGRSASFTLSRTPNNR